MRSLPEHAKSQEMVDQLKVGDRIFVRSGVGDTIIIAIPSRYLADSGAYAGASVLHTTGDEYFPFAIHTLYYTDDMDNLDGWYMTGGQSFQNLTQALDMIKRTWEA